MGEAAAAEGRWPVGRAMAVEVVAYAALAATAVVPAVVAGADGIGPSLPVLCVVAVVLVAMHVCWPFRAGQAMRAISLLFGVASGVCAAVPLPGTLGRDASGRHLPQWVSWSVAAGVLLVLLVIVSFGRQMAREDRSHLIRALSHSVSSGVAAIAAPGWCFLPVLVTAAGSTAFGWVAIGVVLLLAVLLSVASTRWVADMDPEPSAAATGWAGIALLPVMLLGSVIAIAALLLTPLLG